MIITNPDGTKVSSENVDRSGTPMFKCPKCGCLYFSFSDIASFLKLPPVKLHCSMLAEEAIKAAVNDYKKKLNKKI